MENQNNTLTVPFSKLKAVVDQLEKHPVLEDRTEDLTITFEFIIGSLFPTAMQSIHNALQDEHTIGYIEGSHGNNMPLLYHVECPDCFHIWWSEEAFPKYCPYCGKEICD